MKFEDYCSLDRSSVLVVESPAKSAGVKVVYSFAWGPRAGSVDPAVVDPLMDSACNRARREWSASSLKDDPVARLQRLLLENWRRSNED